MDIVIQPGLLHGSIPAIPSKSQAHRLLICAAFANRKTEILCSSVNQDMEATVRCLQKLGADIARTKDGYNVNPASAIPKTAQLPCGESGSTLRFLLPVAGALGAETTFLLEGRLPQRPLSPLWEEMERMGCQLSRPAQNEVHCKGKLIPGAYAVNGSTSSQFITGLLLGLNLLDKPSTLEITGALESKPYVDLTKNVLSLFGIPEGCLGGKKLTSPGTVSVEGDWSNAAFYLAAQALGSSVSVTGLDENSIQGDRAVQFLLPRLLNGHTVIDCSDIPDLVPILAVVAGACHGAVFQNIGRLRLKESDRVAAIVSLVQALGGRAEATDSLLTVEGTGYRGGRVSSFGDHRIAMAAAIASTVCTQPVTLLGAQAVSKSYPNFWADFCRLGGNYEQYIW